MSPIIPLSTEHDVNDLYFFDSQIVIGKRMESGAVVETSIEETLSEMERHRITRGLCYYGGARDYHPSLGNEETVALTREVDALSPLAVMLPLQTGEIGEEDRIVDSFRRDGICGAVVFPDPGGHNFSLRGWCAGALLSFLENLRMPLFISSVPSADRFDDIAEALSSHPNLPIIMWNVGYGFERYWYPLMDTCPNLIMGNSVSRGFLQIETAVGKFGAERFVVESGFPDSAMGPVILAVVDAMISADQKHLIAHGNLERFVSGIRF